MCRRLPRGEPAGVMRHNGPKVGAGCRAPRANFWLMYGYNVLTALDIPRGDVEGVVKIDDETSYVGYPRIGMFSAGVTRSPEHKRKDLANE